MNSRRLMGAYPKAKDHEPIIARCVAQKACSRSLRLDAGVLNHLAPLLSFVRDELGEIGGRHRHRHGAELGDPCSACRAAVAVQVQRGFSLYVREDENARDEDVYDNRVLERVLIPRVFIRFQ